MRQRVSAFLWEIGGIGIHLYPMELTRQRGIAEMNIVDGVRICAKCSVVLKIKETREYLTHETWGVPWVLNVWKCTNCSRTWWVWQGPKSEEPKSENLHMMNKKKRIKELEKRITSLEDQIEMVKARLNTWYWYPPQQCRVPEPEPQITYTWPVTTDANIMGS